MDFDSIGAFALFISSGAVGVCLIYLAGYRMKLRAEMERLRLGASSNEAIEELREEMHQIVSRQSAEIDELSERIDFTERLLAEQKRPRSELREANTPVT